MLESAYHHVRLLSANQYTMYLSGKRSWVMTAGRMSPLAGGRHGSPVLSPTTSLDRPSASLQRMYSMDLPTLSVGPTVVQHTPGKAVTSFLTIVRLMPHTVVYLQCRGAPPPT